MRKVYFVNVEMLCIAAVSFVTLAATLMGSVQIPFRFPFDSIYILLGCFGLHGVVHCFGFKIDRTS